MLGATLLALGGSITDFMAGLVSALAGEHSADDAWLFSSDAYGLKGIPTYIYVYIYTHLHIHIHMRIHMHIHICMCIHINVQMVCIYIHMLHTYVDMCVNLYI